MNFLCISSYSNDLEWLRDYPNRHIIYDKTWAGSSDLPPSNLQETHPNFNIVNSSLGGYNLSDYFKFIIDHYDDLPDTTAFIKGNLVGRHVTQRVFDKLLNNQTFTPFEDLSMHDLNQPSLREGTAMISCDGGWMELNNSWYLSLPHHPTKYFTNYNDFLRFVFKEPAIPRYIRFAPGACYVVPKQYILKYDKVFYMNLKTIVDHHQHSGESHMIERALYTIWTCNFDVADSMKSLL